MAGFGDLRSRALVVAYPVPGIIWRMQRLEKAQRRNMAGFGTFRLLSACRGSSLQVASRQPWTSLQ